VPAIFVLSLLIAGASAYLLLHIPKGRLPIERAVARVALVASLVLAGFAFVSL